tara:strand:+ start:746 stop:901 length:156 start_codon:yes stop_codon:yes gene_type:complete
MVCYLKLRFLCEDYVKKLSIINKKTKINPLKYLSIKGILRESKKTEVFNEM